MSERRSARLADVVHAQILGHWQALAEAQAEVARRESALAVLLTVVRGMAGLPLNGGARYDSDARELIIVGPDAEPADDREMTAEDALASVRGVLEAGGASAGSCSA